MATSKKAATKKAAPEKKIAKKAAPAKAAHKNVAKKDLPEELHTTNTVLIMSSVKKTFDKVVAVKNNAQDTTWQVNYNRTVHLHENGMMSFTDSEGGRLVIHPDSWILLDELGEIIKK